MRLALFFGMVGLASSASAQIHVREPWIDRSPPPRGQAAMIDAMETTHTTARAELGMPPLVWDDGLAKAAKAYARTLADRRIFAHSAPDGRKGQGENLWMGTRGAYRFEEMAGGWVDEKRFYRRGRLPDVARRGSDWQAVGHYTQIIWRTTKRFGCGFAVNRTDEYLVCRYTPPGNVWGLDPQAEEGLSSPRP